MRKGVLLAAVVAAATLVAGPAAAFIVNVQNASPDVVQVTVAGKSCVYPVTPYPLVLPAGVSNRLVFADDPDGPCFDLSTGSREPTAATLNVAIGVAGVPLDSVKVTIQAPPAGRRTYQVPPQTRGPNGLIVDAMDEGWGVTLTVSCPTCKSD